MKRAYRSGDIFNKVVPYFENIVNIILFSI